MYYFLHVISIRIHEYVVARERKKDFRMNAYKEIEISDVSINRKIERELGNEKRDEEKTCFHVESTLQ